MYLHSPTFKKQMHPLGKEKGKNDWGLVDDLIVAI